MGRERKGGASAEFVKRQKNIDSEDGASEEQVAAKVKQLVFRDIPRSGWDELTASEQKEHEKLVIGFERLFTIDSWEDLIGADQIEKDLRWVEKEKRSHGDGGIAKERADLLEAVLNNEAEMSNWMGEDAYTFRTFEYDDFKGVDTVVEWEPEEGGEPPRLAIDFTTASNPAKVREKFDRIRKDLDKKKDYLAQVKYYFSDAKGEFESIDHAPHVVVGLDKDRMKMLAEDLQGSEKGELGEHPVQLVLFEQMDEQLSSQLMYVARKLGRELGGDLASKVRGLRSLEGSSDILRDVLAGLDNLEVEDAKVARTVDMFKKIGSAYQKVHSLYQKRLNDFGVESRAQAEAWWKGKKEGMSENSTHALIEDNARNVG
jgi:hypothetical protein